MRGLVACLEKESWVLSGGCNSQIQVDVSLLAGSLHDAARARLHRERYGASWCPEGLQNRLLPSALSCSLAAQMSVCSSEGNYEATWMAPGGLSSQPQLCHRLRCFAELSERARSCHPCKRRQNNFQEEIRRLAEIAGTRLWFSAVTQSPVWSLLFLSKGGNSPSISSFPSRSAQTAAPVLAAA